MNTKLGGNNFDYKPKFPTSITAKDPVTGLKAKSLTKLGAVWKLEQKLGGQKITNPLIRRGPA